MIGRTSDIDLSVANVWRAWFAFRSGKRSSAAIIEYEYYLYLHEFDRFVVHELKPLAYMRYGDDWLCFASSQQELEHIKAWATVFLSHILKLTINPKLNHVTATKKGISYLGVDIWPTGRRLQPAVSARIVSKLTPQNAASYLALVSAHEKQKRLKELY